LVGPLIVPKNREDEQRAKEQKRKYYYLPQYLWEFMDSKKYGTGITAD